jgi:SPP1 gp7 family putative phage head morphogenesis protein
MSIPEVFFRETIDLNRYSNAVARKYATTYSDVIIVAAKKLKQIDLRQQAAGEGVVISPQTRKRLRSIISQAKSSLNKWSGATARDFKKELQGLAYLQTNFVQNELKKVTKSGNIPINSVAISPKYADSFVSTDPTKVNVFTSKAFKEDSFAKFGQGKFDLTATQGASMTLPNGETVEKAFRGIATRQQESLARHIRQGVFSGESTQEIARRMVGKLEFGTFPTSVKQISQAGGELIKLSTNQIQTIVRTSVNQVQNQASQAVYAANSKVAPKYEYVATLDSRTSPICRRLDGRKFAYNKGPTPPQHFNCRSTTVPVVDYEGLRKREEFKDLTPPPKGKVVTRPTGEGTGRVPQDTQYGDWLLGQDKKLKVKTLGNEQKVRYFERLAKKEGSGQKAIRKMVREDGSERSLKDLERLYGKPRDITIRTKTPKPVAKPVGFERRLVDSSFDQLRKDGKALMDEVGGLDVAKFKKLESDFKQAAANVNSNTKLELQAGLIAKYDKAADSLTSYRVSFSKNLEKLRNKMLETSLTDVQVNKFVNQVSISSSFNASQQAQIKSYFKEYVKMFNGAGFTEAANGVPAVNTIGKAQRGSCRFWKGTFTTGVNRSGVVNKSTTFHEITHVVEVANPKLNIGMNKWKFDKAFGEKGKLGLKKEVREKFLAKPNSRANYNMTEKLEKPIYKLKNITGNRGYKDKELAFVNEYKDAYMGKVYDMYDYSFDYIKGTINPSEVLTMSVETFADVENMETLIFKHPDLFELVVGMSRAGNL